MKIKAITVLLRPGHTDYVIVSTDLPSPLWPYDGALDLKFDTSAGSGEEYVRTHFGITPKVINTKEAK